jgi:hypothetical protein
LRWTSVRSSAASRIQNDQTYVTDTDPAEDPDAAVPVEEARVTEEAGATEN